MPIGIPRPTGKSVRDLHARLEREWRPRFRLDEEFRDLVHQRNKIEVLEESDELNMEPMEIHSGRAGGIIEHAGGLLMARPSFHAEPPTQNTEDARTAEQVERAAGNVFEQELVANNFWPAVGRDVLIYGRAVEHAQRLYRAGVETRGEGGFDFELSIDETATPTTPEAHLFIALE
ncbi:hypothetical protein LCGC14_3043310, partial [marine sediment metagenome]